MTSPTQTAGYFWENEVAGYLRRHGLSIVTSGYRCRLGEIDLVCRDGATLVIVEVRARASRCFGGAAASVDFRKRRKIVQATRHYLMCHPEASDVAVRFDVVAIDDTRAERPKLTWIKNAFESC